MLSESGAPMVSRRAALAWFCRAASLFGLPRTVLAVGTGSAPDDAAGYGRDPDMLRPHTPWPLTLTRDQRACASRLADLLLPADVHGPAPSTLGFDAFIDEWLSAPYPAQQADRKAILPVLAMLDQRCAGSFARADEVLAARLFEQMVNGLDGTDPSGFFLRFRQLCLLGYYTSEAGMKDIGYVAPSPSATFAGPPQEVMVRLGIGPTK